MPPRSKNRQLATLGAVVGAAGLAYGAWRYFVADDRERDDRPRDGTGAASSSKGKEAAKPRHRGTLSLCCSEDNLPPLNLLETLCASYTVHLILRTSAPSSPSDPDNPYPRPPVPSQLYGISNLDPRRILFYSRPEGRIHVARALGCDVHVEVWMGEWERSGPEESRGEGSWVLPEQEVTPQRLVRDLKTFVGSLVFVGEGVGNDEEPVEGPNVRVVKTFEDAVKLLV